VFREVGLSDEEIQGAISRGMLLSAVPATKDITHGGTVESN
jgi:tRNA-binding EMAP/Myf-like protein